MLSVRMCASRCNAVLSRFVNRASASVSARPVSVRVASLHATPMAEPPQSATSSVNTDPSRDAVFTGPILSQPDNTLGIAADTVGSGRTT